jgi:ubiquinone/menaquinone biosynthesis C-methylase UbiE
MEHNTGGDSELIKTYFNEKAESWDSMFAEKNRVKVREMVSRIDIGPGSAALDIGTGTGILIPFLLERAGSGFVYALDIADKMLQKSMGKTQSEAVHYVQADASRAPFRPEVFDIVICYSVFPHFRNKEAVLQEIRRSLKKGGCLYIAHTSGRETINRIHSGIPGLQDDLLPDASAMIRMLGQNGFDCVIAEDGPESYFVKAVSSAG